MYGNYLYFLDEKAKALDMFKAAATKRHAEAMFACGSLLLNDFGLSYSHPDVRRYFERAARDGVLEAQYIYGNLLVSNSEDMENRRHGVELLSMAAKEILLRRQCKCVNIQYQGERLWQQTCTFLYSQLPGLFTKRATDNYIWDHLAENISKMDRMTWNEIRHQVVPVMKAHTEHTSIETSPAETV